MVLPQFDEEEEYDMRGGGRRRTWDDEYVLKRQFSALIPAFDPRPGRTNVNQTQDIEIPPPGEYEHLVRKFVEFVSSETSLSFWYIETCPREIRKAVSHAGDFKNGWFVMFIEVKPVLKTTCTCNK